ncbi:hypothetical protein RE428_44620 [Marinobacter nanhaiticus D15-8W]|uniref:hypothetical protein n=1 Tax=Marinobacter nanhaiticus TaxID=1305740 RepID=UPI0012B65069|nr:hypothetical protein [Marinobacter nanhaiticus]BES73444.1 hypothetical protein RE428_44620 [Marinobacter nanhaiticus D15-8W]
MTKEQILSLLAELQIVKKIPKIQDLVEAKDYKWVIEQPVRVDTSTELMHLNIHSETVGKRSFHDVVDLLHVTERP